MIKFYFPHSENLYTFLNTKYYIKSLKTLANACEKILRLNITSTTKVKAERSIHS